MNSAVGIGPVRKVGAILAWAYSIIFGLGGVAMAVEGHPVPGALLALSAVVALPPITTVAQDHLKLSIPAWLRAACALALILAGAALLPDKPKSHSSDVPQAGFVPVLRGVALAKLLVVNDFEGYLEGRKVVGDWSKFLPLGERVTAMQLFSTYHANEVAADDRFKNKSVVISGLVASINKDVLDNGYLVLRDGDPLEGVHAQLTDETMKYSGRLSRGDEITLTCTGAGMVLGSPILKSCEAVPVVLSQQRTKLDNMVDTFFLGDTGQPNSVRAMIGTGYAVGIAMPEGSACQTTTSDDMAKCSEQMHAVTKDKIKSNYLELSKHFALPPFPMHP